MKTLEYELKITQEGDFLHVMYGFDHGVVNLNNYSLLNGIEYILKELGILKKDSDRVKNIEGSIEYLESQLKDSKELIDSYTKLVEHSNNLAKSYKSLYEYYLKKYNESI